ncbi:MAG: hypothetical protein Q4E22_03450 [Coriobacteriia bacterium]|nr:hypothetical protein [Coriobacteriia bacterium]
MKLDKNPDLPPVDPSQDGEQKHFEELAFSEVQGLDYIPIQAEDEEIFVVETEEAPQKLSAKERFQGKSLDDMSEDEITLLFDESFAQVLDLVRAMSERGELSTFSHIKAARIIPEQFSDYDFEARMLSYIYDEELSRELEFDDIKVLQGEQHRYYYSDRYQSNSWAKAVFLAHEDNDIVTFVTTIRDESQTYPRPMIVDALKNEPFNFSQTKIDELYKEVSDSGNFKDIKEIFASNGDHYFYSDTFLSQAQAQALAEYYSVERPYHV